MFDKKTFFSDMLKYAAMDDDPDVIINRMLKYMCEAFKADRAYIFENNTEGTIDNTYEYCREGVEAEIKNLQKLPYELLGDTWYAQYEKKNNILIFDLEEYRSESEWVYNVLKPQGVNTLVTGPLTQDGKIIGMYGVDNPPTEIMHEISDMIIILEIVITMLLRTRNFSRMVQENAGIDTVEGLPDTRAGILNNVLLNAFATASDYVYVHVFDVKTGITRWSKNMVDFFGLDREYMDDAYDVWMSHIHPDDREAYQADIDAVFDGRSDRHDCQYRALNRMGEYVWVECKGSMITRNNGDKVFAGLMTRLDGQSMYDSLTGLKSKEQFYAYNFANDHGVVMLFGIDFFKHTITTYGYDAGDEILTHIGRSIIEILGSAKYAYRFSGDEFMIIIPTAIASDAIRLFREIRKKISNVILKSGVSLRLSFSGAAVEYAEADNDIEEIVNKLETTLLYVKKDNRGGFSSYNDEMQKRENRTNSVKIELANSVENGCVGFELFYQPWMDENGEKIVGCEALLRWKGSTIKDSYPGEFIPILEESGDIIQVGKFVMREAMRQQKEWEERYGEFLVSFNVSYNQFLQPGYVDEIKATAEELGVNPNHMVIELTESRDVQAPDILADIFRQLREAGFRIALDDFGTGYSSMEMIRTLPCDSVKIEHSFVRELSDIGHDVDFAIIRAILSLCKDIGHDVVVEGVENEKVAEIVKGMHAGYLQGYYYSRPVCKAEFESLVEAC